MAAPPVYRRPSEPPGQFSLAEDFHEYFQVEVASSDELKDSAFRIRYRVYCDEFEYESKENFPDKRERDQYDDEALHCLITHKTSGMPAACVRIIAAGKETAASSLPFEQFIGNGLDPALIENLETDRNKVCEISRLAVDGAFRRRSGEKVSRFGEIDSLNLSDREKRTFNMITVATFLAVIAMTETSGKTDVFAMMEPFLARILMKFGFNFKRIGPDIDYHGTRALYFGRTQDGLAGMVPDLQGFYQAIYVEVKNSYMKDSPNGWNIPNCQ